MHYISKGDCCSDESSSPKTTYRGKCLFGLHRIIVQWGKSWQKFKQYKNLEAWANAEAMEHYWLLASYSELALSAFLKDSGNAAQCHASTVSFSLTHQSLIRRMSYRLTTALSCKNMKHFLLPNDSSVKLT